MAKKKAPKKPAKRRPAKNAAKAKRFKIAAASRRAKLAPKKKKASKKEMGLRMKRLERDVNLLGKKLKEVKC